MQRLPVAASARRASAALWSIALRALGAVVSAVATHGPQRAVLRMVRRWCHRGCRRRGPRRTRAPRHVYAFETVPSTVRSSAPSTVSRRWYETGSVRIRALEPLLGRKMLLTSADLGKQALDDVMTEAGIKPSEVDFFACHQASSWFRRATQKLVGFDHARTVDTFPWAGNLARANLPPRPLWTSRAKNPCSPKGIWWRCMQAAQV